MGREALVDGKYAAKVKDGAAVYLSAVRKHAMPDLGASGAFSVTSRLKKDQHLPSGICAKFLPCERD